MKRDYKNCDKKIRNFYKTQRKNQNYQYVRKMINKYCIFENKGSFWEIFDKLQIVDNSDPDTSLKNYHHLFQTAEGIRKANLPDWMQLVGLIHDLGKIIYLKGCDKDGTSEKEQWGIVGDTFITGCKIPDSIIFPSFNILNQDHLLNDKYGEYSHRCGLNNVLCSFGHDEYLYRLLKFNKIKLPDEAYYMIRFHSLYLWHDKNEYIYFENEQDKKMKTWVRIFNRYDLYTKSDEELNISTLKEYYSNIVDKYFPKEIFW